MYKGRIHGTRSLQRLFGSVALAAALMAGSVLPAMAQADDSAKVTRDDGAIRLFANKGTFIKLPTSAEAVYISEPSIADAEMKINGMLYITGLKPGESTIHVMDKDGKILFNRNIMVTANVGALKDTIASLLPGMKVDVYPINNSIALKGTVRTSAEADMALKVASTYVPNEDDLLNMLNVTETNQITLKVKVAEVRRSVTQKFGIDWQTGGTPGNFVWGSLGANAPLPNGSGAAGFTPGIFSGLTFQGNNNFKQVLSFADGNFSIDAVLNALEDEGMATVLAEPNLTTLSGEAASFLAGGELPILVTQIGTGSNITTIDYKEVGVKLAFTPILMADNRIRLKVAPSVSELSSDGAVQQNGNSIPAITTRKAETTVELGNGQSFTIAGIFQNNMRESIKRFPGLGEVPILGALFRSEDYVRNDSELLIIVTPYLVEPTSETNLATPLDNIKVPDRKDRILYGQSLSSSIRPTNVMGAGTRDIAGPVGFSLD
jgi:pilus assembly protein CpaC